MHTHVLSLGCGLEIYQSVEQLTQNNLCPCVTCIWQSAAVARGLNLHLKLNSDSVFSHVSISNLTRHNHISSSSSCGRSIHPPHLIYLRLHRSLPLLYHQHHRSFSETQKAWNNLLCLYENESLAHKYVHKVNSVFEPSNDMTWWQKQTGEK